MQTVTCRVCAGSAIKQKLRANVSIDNFSHL
ncbi:putative DNase [Escherichia albertii B156]|nr:putative DNase [Escherichia albertii B156]